MSHLLKSITSKELTQWMAFDAISPIGDERQDQQAAMLAALIYNIKRGSGAAKQLVDFMPYVDRDEVKKAKSNDLSKQLLNAFKGIQ